VNALAKYDAMCRAIAAAYEVDEVKGIRDRAIALETCARQAQRRRRRRPDGDRNGARGAANPRPGGTAPDSGQAAAEGVDAIVSASAPIWLALRSQSAPKYL
jgi:hypothetical protein